MKRCLPTILALTGLLAIADAQPGTPPAPAADPQLDALLARWESDMGTVQSLVVEFTCMRLGVGNIQKEFVGSLRCLRLANGNYGASVQLSPKGNPRQIAEQYICTGTHVYNVWPDQKTIYVHVLPPRQQGQAPDEGALPFLFGMKGETARRRYQLRSEESPDPARREWYLYVEAVPNFAKDQQDFKRARLTIMKKDSKAVPAGMPLQVWWVEPNNNKTTWDIVRVQRNVPGLVNASEFGQPNVPRDWKVENVNAPANAPGPASNGRPTVIRPQQP